MTQSYLGRADLDALEPVRSSKVDGFTAVEAVGETSMICLRESDDVLAWLLVEFITRNLLFLYIDGTIVAIHQTRKHV